ncbi:hypothetical protein AB0758_44015 [Tolypothrix bouteillei VB521301_2]|uniref:Uncharacterized protein n=1 Tax=Tolypothrix bouteillei VB521301 TaxID=1479485 RepID=A0A0C1RKV2_9CYAN
MPESQDPTPESAAFIDGLRGEDLDKRNTPNEGIWKSINNAVFFGIVGGLISGFSVNINATVGLI